MTDFIEANPEVAGAKLPLRVVGLKLWSSGWGLQLPNDSFPVLWVLGYSIINWGCYFEK